MTTDKLIEHPWVKDKTIQELIIDALHTDGDHHKQWYLEQILLKIMGELRVNQLHKQEEWEQGIAP